MSNIVKVPVEIFLKNRKKTLEEAKKERESLGNPDWFIIIDTGGEVVCDGCNADVITERNPNLVFIDRNSNYALCEACALEQESA